MLPSFSSSRKLYTLSTILIYKHQTLEKMAIQVKDFFRTHPYSLTPGGYSIKVQMMGTIPCIYDKIKKPDSYIDAVLGNHRGQVELIWIFLKGEWKLVYDKNKE